ncbi:EthD domain-containing protein [Merismopedia glauca]|uniref:Ethyl tert-butyl ether degradation protein EthD n=1 Tax=Merismopedia glauca CCAP 1448/3 TaxID=1296344 RepID=A0A2T1C4Q1_9CYAN|nr:EthD domain-containing protein [Merismopedia glauca]PSB03204.1 ethyl tert-butyl ether degradation protein EthD [Merismopedia glauca CCAP 1448/3]
MIHQLIFAHPKPGMSEKDFQDYWVNVHAVNYASKIPQIKGYLIDTRIPVEPEPADPLFSGVAEIWLNNETEQLASLQTPEFLQGARLDEPKWAAFWRTVVLDTDSHILLEGEPQKKDSNMVKIFAMVKRKEGMSLEDFRKYSLDIHAAKDLKLPGLRRYVQCHVRDSYYSIGEAILDCVSILWFDSVQAIEEMKLSPEYQESTADLENFIEMKYAHSFLANEHWIIGPEFRN